MKRDRLLWVDDEISLLRPHILFLEGKGYEVDTVTNGQDALDRCRATTYDLIFLDENMPGLSGLQTLALIKEICPTVPVIMITKSEEENIMDMAIGQKIADYLIKPVNPNQILLSLKKNLHRRDIVSEAAQTAYQQNFGKIGMQINDSLTATDWMELYRRLVYWELELEATDSPMSEMLAMQKAEANSAFAKFIKKNYANWVSDEKGATNTRKPSSENTDRPLMSPDLFKRILFPLLDKGEKIFFIVLDNFRYDQWRVLANELSGLFKYNKEQNLFHLCPEEKDAFEKVRAHSRGRSVSEEWLLVAPFFGPTTSWHSFFFMNLAKAELASASHGKHLGYRLSVASNSSSRIPGGDTIPSSRLPSVSH